MSRLNKTLARLKWLAGTGPKPRATRLTPRERLAARLRDAGFNCESEDITGLQGAWRHQRMDCLDCWTARCWKDEKPVEITGLDPMTKCARFGVKIERNEPGSQYYGDFTAAALSNHD
jgi:hypothetical protein